MERTLVHVLGTGTRIEILKPKPIPVPTPTPIHEIQMRDLMLIKLLGGK